MIQYAWRELDEDTVRQLIELSRLWMEEDCSYGIVTNEPDDLKAPVAVALDGDRIVGYCFGHVYVQEKKNSCIDAGENCFSVDELYVLPDYRGQGIGKELFQMIQKEGTKERRV